MATPYARGRQVLPESFSTLDRFLVEKTEEAVRDGLQLEHWYRKQEEAEALNLFPLNLKKAFRLKNRAEGFFGRLNVNGTPTSIMGCVQDVDFGFVNGANSAARLRDFVYGEFLGRAHWTYEDGYPGGFGIERSLYRAADGRYDTFPAERRKGVVDWRTLGKEYDWVLLTVHIHDFVMKFGPFVKRFKEAACVAMQRDFILERENPSKDCALEIAVGYPFVAYAPIPNVFGFGPGKFGAAIKRYAFRLSHNNKLDVRMAFMAAPRCRKVFDFGQRIPDPVYGGAELLSILSLRLYKTQGLHDCLDAQMLSQHSRVHQALMDGVEKVWVDWQQGGGS
ncbi:MAG: hypothetical protein WD696_22085 [Bryobacteraceae bacterium]